MFFFPWGNLLHSKTNCKKKDKKNISMTLYVTLKFYTVLENKELKAPKTDGYQEIASNTYFSPSWYTYLQDGLNNNPKVYAAPDLDMN